MAYQALYRTWRPQKFADMVGQEVVTKTLQNALRMGQISHAYLFTGPRGTGKTSAAKIFAKTVNCLHPVDGEADGTCEVCQAIDQGTLGDIIELDAASNNGVDEIREIREDVNYAPTLAKYKVYIIDEVHMLSTGAFNALLKTLEEPPANVIFILATTEPQKIPATIISRTQRFDFRRISANEAYERMVYILQQRDNKYDEKALKVIANSADGGMRDALSILDQALSFGDGQVTLDNALLVTGSVTQTLLGDYLKTVVAHQTDQALAELTKVLAEGKDANRFIEDLISYARDLLIAHEAPELVNLVPDDNFNELLQEDEQLWYQMIDTLNEVQQQLRFTNRPSIYLEVLTVKLSRLELKLAEAQIVQTAAQSNVAAQPTPAEEPAQMVEKPVTPAKTVVPSQPTPTSTIAKANVKKASADEQHVFAVLDVATRGDLNRVEGVWADILAQLEVTKKAMLNTAKPLAASPDGVVLGFDFEIFRDKTLRDETLVPFLMEQMQTLSGSEHERKLVLVTNEEWSDLRSAWVQQHHIKQSKSNAEQAAQPALEESAIDLPEAEAPAPVVQKAREMFGDDLVEVHAD